PLPSASRAPGAPPRRRPPRAARPRATRPPARATSPAAPRGSGTRAGPAPGRGAPRDRARPLRQLLRRIAEDAPRDDQLVDLLRALEDVVDLGVAHPLLEEKLARVAERAQDLHRFLRA